MRTLFICNPASGRRGRYRSVLKELGRLREQAGFPSALVETEGPGHATLLCREAITQGYERVVAVGGDGTMNETARGLVGSETVFGMIPIGSGNGLGRSLRISGNVSSAFGTLRQGGLRRIDSGVVNGLPFFNVMGLGFDAVISRAFNETKRRGFLTYLKTGLTAFFRHKLERVQIIKSSTVSIPLEVFVLAIANSPQYGNNALIAPQAKVDDGFLDLVAIQTNQMLVGAGLAVRLFAGRLTKSRHVYSLSSQELTIDRAAPGLIHTDGEVHEAGARLHVSVRPASLLIQVPGRRGT